MNLIKQNDTTKPIVFLMVDSSNHITGKTGLTPSVSISKNGSAFTTPSGTVSELGYGWYKLSPASSDVDTLGPLILHAEAEGADPVDVKYQVVAFDPANADNLGLTYLDSAISSLPDDIWNNSVIDSNLNAKKILALLAAVLTGKATIQNGTVTFYAINNPTTQRVVALTDSYGNRTQVTIYPPT